MPGDEVADRVIVRVMHLGWFDFGVRLGNMVVFIKENSRRAAIAAGFMGKPNAAMVIGNTIYLWGASREVFLQDVRWVRHEVVHVLQYQKYGVLLFWWLYLADSVRNGYMDNKFEKEARSLERDRKLLDDVTFR